MAKVLDPSQIADLVRRGRTFEGKTPTGVAQYELVIQGGPLRFYDNPMRCSSRGCGSTTYCKVQGVARCYTHALHALNDLLVERGVME